MYHNVQQQKLQLAAAAVTKIFCCLIFQNSVRSCLNDFCKASCNATSPRIGRCDVGTGSDNSSHADLACVMHPLCPDDFYAYRVRIRHGRRLVRAAATALAATAAAAAVLMAIAAPIVLIRDKTGGRNCLCSLPL